MFKYLDQNGWAVLVGILTPLVVALIRFVLAPKAKVFGMIMSENAFNVTIAATQKPSLLFARTLMLRNTGRKEATNIEIALAVPPTVYRVFPPTESGDQRDSTGHFFIKINRLPPRSWLTVETLTENVQPILANISHDEGSIPLRQPNIWPLYPTYVNVIMALCMVVGAMLICYAIARLLLAGASAVGWL